MLPILLRLRQDFPVTMMGENAYGKISFIK